MPTFSGYTPNESSAKRTISLISSVVSDWVTVWLISTNTTAPVMVGKWDGTTVVGRFDGHFEGIAVGADVTTETQNK